MLDQLKVTCITPTGNRHGFLHLAVKNFLRQDYPNRELIIIDDGKQSSKDSLPALPAIRYIRTKERLTIGGKRNLACNLAIGDIIVHWDDDDWNAPWRLSYQVAELLRRKADICGLNKVVYLDLNSGMSWKYIYPPVMKTWVSGNTFCYRKSFWQKNPFWDINVGEDYKFLTESRSKKILTLSNPKFIVGMIHQDNVSPKLKGHGWHSLPSNYSQKLIGEDVEAYRRAIQTDRPEKPSEPPPDCKSSEGALQEPLVSCVMPTYNRRTFVPRAIQYFLSQDYPSCELVIVDDGTDPVEDLVPEDNRITYYRLPKKISLGTKRNIGCSLAAGDIIVWWDDDDWYGNHRISYQVSPILKKDADITALKQSLIYSVGDNQFWSCKQDLTEKMFLFGVLGGTAAFSKKVWSKGIRFPDYSVAEEAAFLKEAVQKGARLAKLENNDAFIYVRHNFNTWRFDTGSYIDQTGWKKVNRPAFLPKKDLCVINTAVISNYTEYQTFIEKENEFR